jgi:hypothetical protein
MISSSDKKMLQETADSMELVYENVLRVFNNQSSLNLGVSEEVLRALVMSAFDLRNGINMCYGAGGWKTYGLDLGERRVTAGHSGEGSCSGGGDCGDCSECERCVGGDQCCKKDRGSSCA